MQRRFLTEIIYNRGNRCDRCAKPLSMADLKRRLAGSVQGTWIVCGDLDTARRIMDQMQPIALDLSIGRFPEDARCFNSVVVCPETWADFPPALRMLALLGVPAPDAEIPGAEIFEIGCISAWAGELPTVDEMREVFKAARLLSRRPQAASDEEALLGDLARESGLSEMACHASLLALQDMQLLEVKKRRLEMLPMKKIDPQTSAVWRAIQNIRNGKEGRELT